MDAERKLVTLVCPRCGADLDVPTELTVFRCSFCGSKVELRQSDNVRGLKLIEEGVQQILAHSQAAATGVNRLVEAQQADAARRKAALEAWQRELESHEKELQVALQRSRRYAALSLLSVFVLGPGASILLGNTVFEHLQLHILWPVPLGVAAAFVLALQHTGYRNLAASLKQKIELWHHRMPLE